MSDEATSNGNGPRGLSRRTFIQLGAAGTVAAAAGPAVGLAETASPPAAANGRPKPWRVPHFELEEVSVAELRAGLESGRWTSRELVEAYLGRIQALDRNGPAMRQVIETNPDALSIADGLDAERSAGSVRGPLHGIPVIVKDNIDTADRMTTTAGSWALEGSIAPRDADIVRRLRAAGAIVLAKANLSEWANFRSTNSSSGWSGRGGQALNPYALDRSPCGSSSGTGGAISASYAAVGIGTETDGSIVCPSSASSLVGIKPTVGLVSRSGIIPISHSQDTAGPMARTVADAAALLGVIAGVDPADPATADAARHVHADYTRFLDDGGLRGARIGVARGRFWGYSTHVDRLGEAAIEALKAAGAVVVDPANLESERYGDDEYTVLLYEFKHGLNAYLAALGPAASMKSLDDVIAFNEAHAELEMPYFGQDIFLAAAEKGPLTEQEYLDARERSRRLARESIDRVMDEHRLDAVVAPTGGPPWPIDLVNGDHFGGGSSSAAAVSGYPNITVPMGYAFGLPVGMSFIGRAWSEPTLIRITHAFERATKHRRPPRFLPTADLSTL